MLSSFCTSCRIVNILVASRCVPSSSHAIFFQSFSILVKSLFVDLNHPESSVYLVLDILILWRAYKFSKATKESIEKVCKKFEAKIKLERSLDIAFLERRRIGYELLLVAIKFFNFSNFNLYLVYRGNSGRADSSFISLAAISKLFK